MDPWRLATADAAAPRCVFPVVAVGRRLISPIGAPAENQFLVRKLGLQRDEAPEASALDTPRREIALA